MPEDSPIVFTRRPPGFALEEIVEWDAPGGRHAAGASRPRDRDGLLDLGSYSRSELELRFGKGDGTLLLPQIVALDASGGVARAAVVDLNHDGLPDAVFANYGQKYVGTWMSGCR